VRIISPKPLRDFYARHPDAEGPIRGWLRVAKNATWTTTHEVKRQYRTASIVGNDRVVFNPSGNKYRLVALLRFDKQLLYVRFIGTHSSYDKIDVGTIWEMS
jgi:mRNA interferase HigB